MITLGLNPDHMPASKDEWKIARSNYLLAGIRQHLAADYETFVKWSATGAFNGAGLVSSGSRSFSLVTFHDHQRDPPEGKYIQAGVGGFWVIVESNNPPKVHQLEMSNSEFDNLMKTAGTDVLNQVKRCLFQVYLSTWDALDFVESFVDAIKAELPIESNSRPEIEPPEAETRRAGHYATELVFDRPLSAGEFLKRLRKHIPISDRNIFGTGVLATLDAVAKPRIDTHIYVRQF